MKKLLFLLTITFFTLKLNAQITFTGNPCSYGSYPCTLAPTGLYTLVQSVGPTGYADQVPDVGTNIYQRSSPSGTGDFNIFTFYRANNYWYLSVKVLVGGSIFSQYNWRKFDTFSNAINPPCLETWIAVSNPSNTELISLTGMCFNPANCNTAFSAFPEYIQMPTLETPTINSISPTHKGMLTYDCEQEKLMLHDGNQWRMVQGSKDDIEISNTGSVSFGNGFNISQASTDGLNINKSNNQIITLNTTGYNKVGINNSSPSSAVHMTGSNAYSVSTTSSDLTLNQNHRYVIVTGTVSRTMTLPDPSTCSGRIYSIANYTTQNVDVTSTTNSIQMTAANQFTTFPLASDYVLILISNGTKWYRMGT